ncbi:MAG: Rieske (2Fe-2S) protein [Nocardioides sp.]
MAADHPISGSDLTRRGMIRGVAAGGLALPLLAACGEDGVDATAPPSSSASKPVSVAVADVPVGGGTILADDLVVVTQPTEGEFKAFTATCTHQGCPVNAITDGEIICPCHASHYSIEDGSVISGPAPKALASFPVAVEGDQIVVG